WPYCYDDRAASPEYPQRASYCTQRTRSPVALPAHASPISIVFYQGAMFPPRFRGRAFVSYHGYRATGHRVVSIPFDDAGAPAGRPPPRPRWRPPNPPRPPRPRGAPPPPAPPSSSFFSRAPFPPRRFRAPASVTSPGSRPRGPRVVTTPSDAGGAPAGPAEDF